MSDPTRDEQLAELLGYSFEGMAVGLRRVAMLLSVCLAASEAGLITLAHEVWHEDSTADVSALLDWPFVEERGDGYRILPTVASNLSRRFREMEPEAFTTAHRILAERERQQIELARSVDEPDNFLDAWYARGRLAFYLAGVQPNESVVEFGYCFEETLSLSPYDTRVWLSTLVLRQRDLLNDYARVIDFFSGFRSYTANRLREAEHSFRQVLAAEDIQDIYRAIALHLYALIVRAPTVSASLLIDSISLSRELRLVQNEVMARNSLAATFLTMSNRLSRDMQGIRDVQGINERDIYSDLAYQAAQENLAVAYRVGDKGLLSYCLAMHATASWIRARYRDPGSDKVYTRSIDELDESIAIADQLGQRETALRALNQRASIHREAGRYEAAIADLKEAVDRLEFGDYPLDLRRRLGQTAGSLRSTVPKRLRKQVRALFRDL